MHGAQVSVRSRVEACGGGLAGAPSGPALRGHNGVDWLLAGAEKWHLKRVKQLHGRQKAVLNKANDNKYASLMAAVRCRHHDVV